jgi:hypothetical protein
MTGSSRVAYCPGVKHFLLLCAVAGLASSAAPAAAEGHSTRPIGAPGARGHAKPSAPVQVRLESRPVAGGYEVTLVAVPTRAVPALELSLAGKRLAFAATAAGQPRTLTVQVPVAAGAGADLVGGAAIGSGNQRRTKAAVLRVGALLQQAPSHPVTRTLPDGRSVAEVR